MHDLIRESWAQHTRANDVAENISIKLCHLRKVLAKWEQWFKDGGRSEKEDMLKEMENFENLEKRCNLSLDENSRVLQLRRNIEEICR